MLCIFYGTSAKNQAVPSRCSRKVIGESCMQDEKIRLANMTRWHKIFPFTIPVRRTRRGISRRSVDLYSLFVAKLYPSFVVGPRRRAVTSNFGNSSRVFGLRISIFFQSQNCCWNTPRLHDDRRSRRSRQPPLAACGVRLSGCLAESVRQVVWQTCPAASPCICM